MTKHLWEMTRDEFDAAIDNHVIPVVIWYGKTEKGKKGKPRYVLDESRGEDVRGRLDRILKPYWEAMDPAGRIPLKEWMAKSMTNILATACPDSAVYQYAFPDGNIIFLLNVALWIKQSRGATRYSGTLRVQVIKHAIEKYIPVPQAILEEYKGEDWADEALNQLAALKKAPENTWSGLKPGMDKTMAELRKTWEASEPYLK